MATPVVKDLLELYKAADVDAITFLMSRLGECICSSLSYCLKSIQRQKSSTLYKFEFQSFVLQ